VAVEKVIGRAAHATAPTHVPRLATDEGGH